MMNQQSITESELCHDCSKLEGDVRYLNDHYLSLVFEQNQRMIREKRPDANLEKAVSKARCARLSAARRLVAHRQAHRAVHGLLRFFLASRLIGTPVGQGERGEVASCPTRYDFGLLTDRSSFNHSVSVSTVRWYFCSAISCMIVATLRF